MNRPVNAIAGRLSLRPPQRRSLEMLDRITEIAPPKKGTDAAALSTALEAIRSEFPSVTDFERDFPSLCFALATGVGKTRLMGAFISYLYLAHGITNFFVLAPNLTIYNKLIADFTPNTPKYVFKGIAEFASDAPIVITGDNYEQTASGTLFGSVRSWASDPSRFRVHSSGSSVTFWRSQVVGTCVWARYSSSGFFGSGSNYTASGTSATAYPPSAHGANTLALVSRCGRIAPSRNPTRGCRPPGYGST